MDTSLCKSYFFGNTVLKPEFKIICLKNNTCNTNFTHSQPDFTLLIQYVYHFVMMHSLKDRETLRAVVLDIMIVPVQYFVCMSMKLAKLREFKAFFQGKD